MTERRRQGPIETATRAMVRSLGAMSARQQVTAAAAVGLATRLDGEDDGAKSAALSRELRQLVGLLNPAAMPVPVKAQAEVHADPIQRLQDELARKRQQHAG